MTKRIDFQTDPSRYRHWRVAYDGDTATLYMDVAEKGGLFEGYGLKLNSYDLGVDIELADVVQRMRFEHPEVEAVVLRSGKDTRVLRRREHPHAGQHKPRPQGQFLQVHQRDPQHLRGPPAPNPGNTTSARSRARARAAATSWRLPAITSS